VLSLQCKHSMKDSWQAQVYASLSRITPTAVERPATL
jgi:hypothetical protein